MGWKDAPLVESGPASSPAWMGAPELKATPAAPAKASWGDTIAGLPITRLAMGAASPLIGSAQIGAHIGDAINRLTGQEPVVSPWIDKKLSEYEAAKQRGMKAAGNEGFDWMGLGGSFVPGAAIAKSVTAASPKTLQMADAVWKRFLNSTIQGGVAAGTQPIANVENGEFFAPKAQQTGAGAALGGALSLGTDAAKAVGNLVAPIKDLFGGQQGIENLARRGYEKNIGKDRVDEVADALLQVKQPVPGYKPTAAEAVAAHPAGSPVQALQRITARTEGGPSAAFGERIQKQDVALDVAGRTRDALTAPLRKEALALANQGKVQADDVIQGIQNIQKQPDLAASDVVSKSLAHLQDKLASLTDENGVIDARALYTVRKELGNTIKQFSKETQNWDKRLTGRIEGDIQKGMDWAINNAIRRAQSSGAGPTATTAAGSAQAGVSGPTLNAQGELVWSPLLHRVPRSPGIEGETVRGIEGPVERTMLGTPPRTQIGASGGLPETLSPSPLPGAPTQPGVMPGSASTPQGAASSQLSPTVWDRYLKEYSGRSQDMAKALEMRDLSKHPVQSTTLQASKDIATSGIPHLALLSRPVVIANALLSHLGKTNIEPKIDALNTQMLLDPQKLGQFLKQGNVPSRYQPMIDALLQRQAGMAGTTAGRMMGGEQ